MKELLMNRPQKRLKVILIGDKCIDEYHYGNIDRLSPEAPIPVFVPNRIESKNGMAANVEENLKALGVEVISYFGSASVKARMIDERTKQHILRIDNDVQSEPLDHIKTYFPKDVDGIIISDYNKGFVSYELIESLIQTGIPVFVDTKKTDLARFNNAFIKINSTEYASAKSIPMNLIVTLGEHGAMWNQRKYDAPKVEIADVCGAGDTFLASFAFEYLQTKNIDRAIMVAIKASSITVKHIGVYAPSIKEIYAE
jgi:bifunctional ADP-heptose synthase (sugar kinase/adenylyltransferase)